MFTTIMYGFINEVTRQPASTDLTLTGPGRGATSLSSVRHRIRKAARPTPQSRPLPGQYRVLADSFKRAAGFH
jgi:hypothetical protein